MKSEKQKTDGWPPRFVLNKGGDAYGVNIPNNYFFHFTNN